MMLSRYQAEQLLEARKNELKFADISLDLNMSITKIKIEDNSFILPDRQKFEFSHLKKIIKDSKSCFLAQNNSLSKMQWFSEQTNRFYKLVPTKDAPTIEISGIRMHATKDMTPMEDTKRKIESIMPNGMVLDTCMGLGYTAIAASKFADFVITCEKDENVLEIAKLNPWSKELFNNKKINILKANIMEQIKLFKSNMFDAIIHDPPRLSLATELYSLEFYKQIFRVLKSNGKIYHYTGSPGSKNRKINLAKNAGERLRVVGFKDIQKAHYGLTAKR